MDGRMTWTLILLGVMTGMTAKPHTTGIQKNATTEHPYKHLNKDQLKMIKRICNSTHSICPYTLKSRSLCTIRLNGDKREYRDYKDDCFRNVDNICNQPEHDSRLIPEFIIVQSGPCEDYLSARRAAASDVIEVTTSNGTENATSNGTEGATSNVTEITGTEEMTTMKRIYSDEYSWNGKTKCPYSCTDVYKPECLIVNFGHGMIKKYYAFLNHCHAIVYFCKHRKEFDPPPEYDWPLVKHSELDYKRCGSSRYVQFARFSETASSLGHYGWLRGAQNYRHIMNRAELKALGK